jgi:hypothetical protein
MNENGIRISYERLFNMGNFEHEKYTISKDVDCNTEFEVFKELSLKIVNFEDDLKRYRGLFDTLRNAQWLLESMKSKNVQATAKQIKQAEHKIANIQEMIRAFKEEHKPVFQPCKCYYCTHRDDEYNDTEDE